VTHPAVDPDAVARLRRATGEPASEALVLSTGAAEPAPATTVARARAFLRRATRPVVDKARHELAQAATKDTEALHAEVASLREELSRTRADLEAQLAVIQEQLPTD
jgi:hypothetical protein